jgi:putative oxidoreductase
LRISGGIIGLRTLEVVLGGLFFYAGLQKVLHPYEFAEAVLAYRLLPESLVGLAAAGLPWAEIAAGFCLVAGLKPRSCLLILAGLVAVFLVVILITMARGLKIDCGCGLFFQRQVGLAAVLEDAVLLIWAAGLYWWELLRSEKCGPGSIAQTAPER